LNHLPLPADSEDFQTLLSRPGVRIERIVSDGQASPPGFWYDQQEDEWVLILQGQGEIEFADGQYFGLQTGDTLLIPARCRHRVVSTAARTVWLAVFLSVG
jgi:cupin 2 domain-containing protein